MRLQKFSFLLFSFLILAGCGESSITYSEASSQIQIDFRKTTEVDGSVEQYTKADKSDLVKTDFKTAYYDNGMRYTAQTNKGIKTDVLSCSLSVKGTSTTYSYDFVTNEYTAMVGSTSFVPTFTSLVEKMKDYSQKAENNKADADSYSCTDKRFSAVFERMPIVVDTSTKTKLIGVSLNYDGTYLTSVDFTTLLSNVYTHSCSTYTYGTLSELAKTDLPDVSSNWTLKE